MVASIQGNASALQAFTKKLSVSANNVANAFSDDFNKSRAVNTEGSNGQVNTIVTQVDTAGPLVADPLGETGELKELSNTDITEELTNQMIIKHGFEANAKVIQTQDEILGTLIDILG